MRILITLLCLLASSPVAAQTPAAAGAESMFTRGLELMNESRYAEACDAFTQSQRLDPQLGTLYNLADCNERLGKIATAWLAYREVAQRDSNQARRASAATRAAELDRRLPRVLIRIEPKPANLTITLDGDDATNLLGIETPIDPGSYEIIASAPRYQQARITVHIAAQPGTVTATLPALVPAPASETASADAAHDAQSRGAPLQAAAATSPTFEPADRFVLQAGAGVITPSSIDVGGVNDSTAAGPYLTLAADLLVSRGASIGAYVAYADLDEVAVKAAGVSFKGRIALHGSASLRIGLGVAYQSSNLYFASDTATSIGGLGITPFAELAFGSRLGLTLQVAAVSQPTGGADGVSVTWYPIPTIAVVAERHVQ